VTFLFQLVLLTAVALSVVTFLMVAERRRLKRISTRETIEFSYWYDLFYGPESGLPAQKVRSVIEVISNSIGVQATQLRPTDRFDCELSIPEAIPFDYTIEVLQESLSEAFNTSITIYPEWHTVDDVIRGIVPNIR
jgi:hypothetical protein